WVWDSSGDRYLDFYNNVPSVGHCHPDVVAALVRQASAININTRYLHESLIELAESLAAKLPPHLDNCVFACTGTEVNDLAVQVARQVTGNYGVLVGAHCYHGNSDLVLKLSTSSYPEDERPDWLAVFEVPDPYRGSYTGDPSGACDYYLAQARDALDAMEAKGHQLAALLVEPAFEAHGVVVPPPGYLIALCEEVRKRGGLVIADEVQGGYCRMGTHWWSYQHHNIEPDMVTCGKPMGDGHPLSALVTRRDVAESYSKKYDYFNTFAGNPVSASVGKAVIDVIDRENLLQLVTDSGAYLSEKLRELETRHDVIGCVRGYGMFQGLDIVTDPKKKTPISSKQLRHLGTLVVREGVLTGTSGRYENVLKIRPPLPATREHVDIAVNAIDKALTKFAEELS
ncbi:MAG: aminotransferase class III-fold pyridoxal phosphate-dependent enzyme, partial [Pseudomonadota bacterium]